MNCKFICYLILIATIFVSCSKENIESSNKADALNTQNVSDKLLDSPNTTPEITTFGTEEIDTTYALEVANESMITFVNEVRNFYTNGMTYTELKISMDPENGLANISDIGDTLLHKAYYYIINDSPESEMYGLEFVRAIKYVAQTNVDRGIIFATDDNMITSLKEDLFGLPDNVTMGDGDGFWGSIWNGIKDAWHWLISDGPDEDKNPRYQEILSAAKTMIMLLQFLGV